MEKIHLGLILDGNRRYSNLHKIPLHFKHLQGAFNIIILLEYIIDKIEHINEITIYALSLDNIKKRDKSEITELMKILELFTSWINEIKKSFNVSFNFVGDYKDFISEKLQNKINALELDNENYDKKINIAFCYDGKQELITASELANKNNNSIIDNLYIKSNIDLVIRTGGNYRMSGFFPWQTMYSEWYFSKKLWPEFTIKDFDVILKKFFKIKRNFGK